MGREQGSTDALLQGEGVLLVPGGSKASDTRFLQHKEVINIFSVCTTEWEFVCWQEQIPVT